jgi:hypothetical protein
MRAKITQSVILLLSFAIIGVIAVGGCTGTKAAYREADTLQAYAYVVTEHYAATLHEAKIIADEQPELRAKLQAADLKVAPHVTRVREIIASAGEVLSATDEIELQEALNRLVLGLHEFALAVKGAR